MVRRTTVAALFGILTGLALGLTLYTGVAPERYEWGTFTVALGAVLILDSVIALVGPKRIFYFSAVLSGLLVVSEWLGAGSEATPATLAIMALAFVTFVLSIVAARFETKVSEQSHPMNLPVFG